MTFALRNVSFRYPDGRVGLDGVTADIPAGGTTAVLGQSGAGKTTLLHLLGLLRAWDHARQAVLFRHPDRPAPIDYADLTRRPGEQAGLRQAAFGVVLQTSYLLPHFSCLQNIALPLALAGVPRAERERRAADLMARAGDAQLLDVRDLKEVSTGQRQRVAALRALVHDPVVVFADEPTSNLDPGNADRIMDLFDLWRSGRLADPVEPDGARRSLVLVCHHLETALARATHVIVIDRGRVFREFPTTAWAEHADPVCRLLGRTAFPLPAAATARPTPS